MNKIKLILFLLTPVVFLIFPFSAIGFTPMIIFTGLMAFS